MKDTGENLYPQVQHIYKPTVKDFMATHRRYVALLKERIYYWIFFVLAVIGTIGLYIFQWNNLGIDTALGVGIIIGPILYALIAGRIKIENYRVKMNRLKLEFENCNLRLVVWRGGGPNYISIHPAVVDPQFADDDNLLQNGKTINFTKYDELFG